MRSRAAALVIALLPGATGGCFDLSTTTTESSGHQDEGGDRDEVVTQEWMTNTGSRTFQPAALPELRSAKRVWDEVQLTLVSGLEVKFSSARVGQAAGYVVAARALALDTRLETFALAEVSSVRVRIQRRERAP